MAALAAGWGLYQTLDSPPSDIDTLTPNDEPVEDDDARFRRLVVGTWEDDYEGKRTMVIAEDGSATMVVELDGWKASGLAWIQE